MNSLTKFTSKTIFLFMLFILFEACKKENTSTSDNNDSPLFLRATLNDKPFQIIQYKASLTSKTLFSPFSYIAIKFIDSLNNSMSIFFLDTSKFVPALRTYRFPDQASFNVFENNLISGFGDINGSVTLTKLDFKRKKISGIFSFTLADMNGKDSVINVKDGVFNNLDFSELPQ